MKTFISITIGFVFFANLAVAQMTTFSQGDILSAGAMNQNFNHLQNQFGLNKTEVDCSSDNLTQKINQGFNHIVLNGNCSIKNLFLGNLDISSFCGYSQSTKGIDKLIISGKTGISDDSITINGTDNCDGLSTIDGGQLFLENLTVNSNKITADSNSMIRMFNVNVTGSGDQQIGTQRNGHINMENVTSTHHMYAESGSMFFMKNVTSKELTVKRNATIEGDNVTATKLYVTGNSFTEFENLTIDCSSNRAACIEAYYGSTIRLEDSTITGHSDVYTIYMFRSTLDLKTSTINSSRSDGPSVTIDNSYINAGGGGTTIQGQIQCSRNGFGYFESSHTTDGCN